MAHVPPDRIPGIIADVGELKADVHDIDNLLRDARERLSAMRAELRVVIGLLAANGVLNLVALVHKP